MRKLLTTVVGVLLVGCANGIPTLIDDRISEENQANVKKVFAGVPIVLGMEGSAVRLNEDWMITAAHNEFILESTGKEVYYHPTCDIAIYRNKGEGQSAVGTWNFGDTLHNVGYPTMLPLSVGSGKFIANATNPNTEYDQCIVAATEGAVMGGMSGGGVYNEHQELVGIIHGFNSDLVWEDGTNSGEVMLFTSIWVVREGLNEITGEKYFE